jgi:GT2 family glycosyltransferase
VRDPRPSISLIIVNYNSSALTTALLDSVADCADEVIIVDNASPADSLGELADRYPAAKLVALDHNRGYGTGANEGVRHATGEVLVVSNPDVDITGPALHALADVVGRHGIVLAAPRFCHPDGSLQRSAHQRDLGMRCTVGTYCRPLAALMVRLAPDWHPTLLPSSVHDRDLDVLHVAGALMAIDAVAFRAIGGFDEGFFLYREETDLCRRLRLQGGRIRHVGSVVAGHIGGASTVDGWPLLARPGMMASHYRYIGKHWGRVAALCIRAAGAVSCALWVLTGPERSAARRALWWHLGGRLR